MPMDALKGNLQGFLPLSKMMLFERAQSYGTNKKNRIKKKIFLAKLWLFKVWVYQRVSQTQTKARWRVLEPGDVTLAPFAILG